MCWSSACIEALLCSSRQSVSVTCINPHVTFETYFASSLKHAEVCRVCWQARSILCQILVIYFYILLSKNVRSFEKQIICELQKTRNNNILFLLLFCSIARGTEVYSNSTEFERLLSVLRSNGIPIFLFRIKWEWGPCFAVRKWPIVPAIWFTKPAKWPIVSVKMTY
jgi:hypothetical protein